MTRGQKTRFRFAFTEEQRKERRKTGGHASGAKCWSHWGHSFVRHPSDANAFFRDLEGVEKRQFSQFELFSLAIITRKGLIR